MNSGREVLVLKIKFDGGSFLKIKLINGLKLLGVPTNLLPR